MLKTKNNIFLILFLVAVVIISPFATFYIPYVSADNTCLNFTGNPQDKKAVCEAELASYQKEIDALQAQLDSQKKKSGTISADVSILQNEIAQAKTKIKSRQITIEKLAGDIKGKELKIVSLEDKISNQKESLGQLVRKTNELENRSFVGLILSSRNLSDFYSDAGTFSSIKTSLKNSVDELRGVRNLTESEKEALQNKKDQELGAKTELENAKKKVEVSESEKKRLLSLSKQKESEYAKYKSDKELAAAKIRAALFTLAGGGGGIKFGDAYAYALEAQQKTGVNPAFLLAIFTQESNLGQNTGTCYLSNSTTGAGITLKTKSAIAKVMSPTRDVPVFLRITAALGRDPYKTLVSCPQAIGWGGAMGPAQFIPSTWVMFQEKVKAATGKKTADPWVAEDAFMASAIYLANLGAGTGNYADEKNAACKYYSGQSCIKSKAAAGYGASVMAKKNVIQTTKIDPINNL